MISLLTRRLLPLAAPQLSIYQAYEQQRRQRLLGVLLPLSAAIFGATSLIFTARLLLSPAPIILTSWILYGTTLLITLCFSLGTLAIRRGRIGLAAAMMISTGSLGLLFILAFQVFFEEGLDAYTLSEFLIFGCVLILVGVLGNLWTVVGATLVVNMLTVFILLQGPRPASLASVLAEQVLSITIATLVLEWLIAAFLIANWLTYRHTLGALGAAYERIQQAEQLDELKDQFISHINHELRTPIMALQGYVEYLKATQQELTEDERSFALEKASRAGAGLVALLSSILEVRRIDGKTDAFVPTAVPVGAALEAALVLMNPQESSRIAQDLHVVLPKGIAIWGEPVRFQQILTNLLSNALKYSSPGTPIVITAQIVAHASTRSRRQKGHHHLAMVEIQVRDAGLGIPPEQIPLLFNRFVRLPRDLASSVVGSGLGLYLCRVMTESMGGTIRVESAGVAGEGSTFFVRLPLPPTEANPPTFNAQA